MSNHDRFSKIALLAVAFLLIVLPHLALAQSGGGYDLTWNTQDGGGATFSSGGGFSLGGTIGQPDASVALVGGGYSLIGGFWPGIPPYNVFLPLILKQ
jgi:hypothetical protein